MKILFASDLHGSKYYTEKLIQQFKKENADKLILLGDILYHGPRNPLTKDYNPQEVARLLNQISEKIISVRGNCDSEVDQMVINFPIMADYAQIIVDNHTFFLTHGHIYQPSDLNIDDHTVFVLGHTHIPVLEKQEVYVLNPGSISLPKDNYPNTYAIYEKDYLQIKTFSEEVIMTLSLK